MPTLDVQVVLLPSLLTPAQVEGRVVVVFDVLRATTTMTAALAHGVAEIRLYPSVATARAGYAADERSASPKLLVGEAACLPPEGFHLGNSPGGFTPAHADHIVHMATTNGTKALLTPQSLGQPKAVLAGALVNRLAIAKACVEILTANDPIDSGESGSGGGGDLLGGVTLLCAGTDGDIAYEDVLGCGAVLESLVNLHVLGPVNDSGILAMGAWTWSAAGIVRAKPDEPAYPAGFRLALGAKNIVKAGLPADIAFAARPDVFTAVGQLEGTTLRNRNAKQLSPA